MGEDFIRKSNTAYRRLLQEAPKELAPSPLLLGPEEEVTFYPCQLLSPDTVLVPGKKLTLFRHSRLARVAVLDGNKVIGAVSGEAVKELRRLFDRHKRGAPGAIAAEVTSTVPGSVQFDVGVLAGVRRPRRK
jgi:hypothetical protein